MFEQRCSTGRCTVTFRLQRKEAPALFFVGKFSHVGCNLTVSAEGPAASGLTGQQVVGMAVPSGAALSSRRKSGGNGTMHCSYFSPEDWLAGSVAKCLVSFSQPRHRPFPSARE